MPILDMNSNMDDAILFRLLVELNIMHTVPISRKYRPTAVQSQKTMSDYSLQNNMKSSGFFDPHLYYNLCVLLKRIKMRVFTTINELSANVLENGILNCWLRLHVDKLISAECCKF